MLCKIFIGRHSLIHSLQQLSIIVIAFLIARTDAQNDRRPHSFRRNYGIQMMENWNGHIYLTRQEQPFFRVYHQPHMKVKQDDPVVKTVHISPGQQDENDFAKENEGAMKRLKFASIYWKARKMAMERQQENGQNQLMMGRRGEQFGNPFTAPFQAAQINQQLKLKEDIEQEDHENDNQQKKQQKLMKLTKKDWWQKDESIKMQKIERKQNRTSAKFGHHHLPKGEKRDKIDWPPELKPFMSCLSLGCVCPLFKGSLEGEDTCILPNGHPLKRAIRKELRTYSDEELTTFVQMMREFKASGLYSHLGMIHRRSGVHSGPAFFPWHREFIKRLEIVYRTFYPEDNNEFTTMGLPYFDSTLDNNLPSPQDSILFSEYLLGEADESGFVTNGLFANWTTIDGRHSFQRLFGDQPDGEFFNEARIDFVLSQNEVNRVMAYSLPLQGCTNYTMDDRFLEYSHDYVHYFFSGDMQERFSSSNDPIFFMHHTFVDSIWELWRQKKLTRLERERQYPADHSACMPEWHFSTAKMPGLEPVRNLEGLSNAYTDNMYTYQARPSCPGGKSTECGNTRFLWCDTMTNPGFPVCSSKVKPGGDCRGFEGSLEACYKGVCSDDGLCSE